MASRFHIQSALADIYHQLQISLIKLQIPVIN